jgi:hypothetical protein
MLYVAAVECRDENKAFFDACLARGNTFRRCGELAMPFINAGIDDGVKMRPGSF